MAIKWDKNGTKKNMIRYPFQIAILSLLSQSYDEILVFSAPHEYILVLCCVKNKPWVRKTPTGLEISQKSSF